MSIWHHSLLKNDDFTIISNNCWGGCIYKYFGLKFQTPFIGMYFFADEYLKLLSNLEYYLKQELIVKDYNSSKYYDEIVRRNQTPLIGVLGDVEFVLLHYKTKEEAIEKWNYRLKRINYDRLIIKFNDTNLCTDEHIVKFDKLSFKNKICFTAKQFENCTSVIYFKEFKKIGYVKSDTQTKIWRKYLNMIKYLNSIE